MRTLKRSIPREFIDGDRRPQTRKPLRKKCAPGVSKSWIREALLNFSYRTGLCDGLIFGLPCTDPSSTSGYITGHSHGYKTATWGSNNGFIAGITRLEQSTKIFPPAFTCYGICTSALGIDIVLAHRPTWSWNWGPCPQPNNLGLCSSFRGLGIRHEPNAFRSCSERSGSELRMGSNSLGSCSELDSLILCTRSTSPPCRARRRLRLPKSAIES